MMKLFLSKVWYRFFFALFFCGAMIGCEKDNDGDGGIAPEISLNKEELILEIGSSERLVASFNPPETPNKAHTWASSAADIASVDETGLVKALSIGEAVITATALDGRKTATCRVKVETEVIHVTGISLNYAKKTLAIGEQLQLIATIKPSNASNKTVKWTSDNEEVATVTSDGQVTALSEGDAVITAISNDGNQTASCQLKVKDESQIVTDLNFKLTDVYEDKLLFVASVGDGPEEVNICFGTHPDPTVTSDNVTKVTADDNGNLTLKLDGLESGTTYYVRSYSRTDTGIEYGDDQVSAQTFGGDIQMESKYSKKEKYEDNLGFEHYYVYLKINYKIKGEGTYLVKSEGDYALSWTLLAKENSYSSELYIEGGEGSFNCRRSGGLTEYEGRFEYLQFYENSLVFTDLNTSVRYHSPALPSKIYM